MSVNVLLLMAIAPIDIATNALSERDRIDLSINIFVFDGALCLHLEVFFAASLSEFSLCRLHRVRAAEIVITFAFCILNGSTATVRLGSPASERSRCRHCALALRT